MGRVHDWYQDIKENKNRIIIAILFLIIASTLSYIAGSYTSEKAITQPVADLILDHIPTMDLSIFFVWLFLLVFVVVIIYPFIFLPKKIHYYFGALSLFIAIRAFFVTLTHLETPLNAVPAQFPWITNKLLFSNDLFFSGHVGLAFLGFLLFRKDNKILAYFMLLSSIVLSATVLLMHQHYSIDVFAAFFITYGIYKIANYIFRD